jgi:hypothetical protein|tara:strand:+ start:6373 stop:6837 length:465 start_codon:yes stop_codon:yes gene_type:complete
MRLSNNLTLAEVTKSATAKRKGISNEPTIEHLENLKALALNIFQPLRNYFGVPITVSSGYRSAELNSLIGGSTTSQHCKGEAIDIDVYGNLTNADVFSYLREHTNFDQLIWEFGDEKQPDWVHCSYKRLGRNRGEVLRAVRVNGKVRYEIYGNK